MATPQLAYHGRYRQDSLFWLTLAGLLGGLPLAVYLTSPEATAGNLVLAVVCGLPLFILSLYSLGRSKTVLLFRGERKLVFLEGMFHHRRRTEYSFSDVKEVHLVLGILSNNNRGASSKISWYSVHLKMTDGSELVLDERSSTHATTTTMKLSKTLGAPAYYLGELLSNFDPGTLELREVEKGGR